MRGRWIAALCLTSVLLAGCGKSVDAGSYAAVETGMTAEQVLDLLGQPDRTRNVTVGGLSGSHMAWQGDGFVVTVQLVDGKVVAKQWIDGGD